MRWIWSVMKNVAAARSEVQLGRELFRLLPRGGLIVKSFARRELDSVLIRASEQCDELSLGFSTGENKEVTDRSRGRHGRRVAPKRVPPFRVVLQRLGSSAFIVAHLLVWPPNRQVWPPLSIMRGVLGRRVSWFDHWNVDSRHLSDS